MRRSRPGSHHLGRRVAINPDFRMGGEIGNRHLRDGQIGIAYRRPGGRFNDRRGVGGWFRAGFRGRVNPCAANYPPLAAGAAFLQFQLQRPYEGRGHVVRQPLATHRQRIGHVFQLERQIGRDDELERLATVPGLLRLQPAFRALPAVCAEMVGRKTMAAQSELESFQTRRQPGEGDDGMPQRTSGIFRNANRQGSHSVSSKKFLMI